jgi:hypothetical protein
MSYEHRAGIEMRLRYALTGNVLEMTFALP